MYGRDVHVWLHRPVCPDSSSYRRFAQRAGGCELWQLLGPPARAALGGQCLGASGEFALATSRPVARIAGASSRVGFMETSTLQRRPETSSEARRRQSASPRRKCLPLPDHDSRSALLGPARLANTGPGAFRLPQGQHRCWSGSAWGSVAGRSWGGGGSCVRLDSCWSARVASARGPLCASWSKACAQCLVWSLLVADEACPGMRADCLSQVVRRQSHTVLALVLRQCSAGPKLASIVVRPCAMVAPGVLLIIGPVDVTPTTDLVAMNLMLGVGR